MPSMMSTRSLARRPQRGLSLLFAMLALVALSLAAVGLVRSVGTGSLVVGNLGFKMDATATADRGAELAITWLTNNLATVNGATGCPLVVDCDVTTAGYYSTSRDALDPTARGTAATRAIVDWNNDNCAAVSASTYTACLDASAAQTFGGNTVNWIITRLCASTGSKDDASNSCATSLASGTLDDANSSGLDYSSPGGLGVTTSAPYYRIVVRTVGARNTVSYTETIVHF